MKLACVANVTRGTVLAERAQRADRLLLRLRGLLGRRGLAPGEGLLITPCQGVHTLGMRFPIDVVYIGRDLRVVGVAALVPPNRWGPWRRECACVLEVPPGTIAATGTCVGDRIEVVLG